MSEIFGQVEIMIVLSTFKVYILTLLGIRAIKMNLDKIPPLVVRQSRVQARLMVKAVLYSDHITLLSAIPTRTKGIQGMTFGVGLASRVASVESQLL